MKLPPRGVLITLKSSTAMTQANLQQDVGDEARAGALSRLKHRTDEFEVDMVEPTREAEWGQVYSAGDSTRSFVEGLLLLLLLLLLFLVIGGLLGIVTMNWVLIGMDGLNCTRSGAAEVISAIEYDRSGDFLATGNKGGRVSIYCRHGNPTSVTKKTICIVRSTAHVTSNQVGDVEPEYVQRNDRPAISTVHGVSESQCRVRLFEKSGN